MTDAEQLERLAGYYDALAQEIENIWGVLNDAAYIQMTDDVQQLQQGYMTLGAEGLAADQRHAALEQRVKALETTLAEGLTAAYLLGCADTRALIRPLTQRLDNLIEQVLALQAHVQLVEPTFNERTGTFRPAGVQP